MSLSHTEKQSLINELYQLSTDTELLPFINEATTSRINRLLQTVNFNKETIDIQTPVKPASRPVSMSKKKHKTEMEQIQEINQQYEQKFAHLFQNDSDNDYNILKEIDVHLNTQTMAKSNLKYNNFIESQTFIVSNHFKNNENAKPIKAKLSKSNSKKSNITSLTSTHSNFFNIKATEESTLLKRRPSKEKLISYKIKTQDAKKNYDICTPSPNKLTEKKQNTPSKVMMSQSRGNLQPITKSPINKNNSIMKRSQSQSTKFIIKTNPASLNSTSKYQKLPLLRTSQSKSSLSTNNLKSASKKSISAMEVTATKRQFTLLPNLDIGDKNLRARIIKEEIIESGIASRAKEAKRSKSKENNTQAMKKGMKRSHTQCSVEKLHLKDDFLSQRKADEELDFNLVSSSKKPETPNPNQPTQQNRRVATQMHPEIAESSQSYFDDQSQLEPEQQEPKEQQQSQLDQGQPVFCIDYNQLKQVGNQTNVMKGEESDGGKKSGYNYLKKIMNQINEQREQKLRQKVTQERQIAELKDQLAHEKKTLQTTLFSNSKLQNEILSITSLHKSISNQRSLLSRCIAQTKKKTFCLKQSLSKNHTAYQKLITQQLKEEQQLIEMYENVIEQLRAQIKQQLRKKLQAKNLVQLCLKKKENKSTRFNSTLLSSQQLKHNLTDAFKQWI